MFSFCGLGMNLSDIQDIISKTWRPIECRQIWTKCTGGRIFGPPFLSRNTVCAQTKKNANPLLLLQESFDHLNFSFPDIIPSEMPLQSLISSFTSFQLSYLLPTSSPSVLQNGFSFNMCQQLFVRLWKVPTDLLNLSRFLLYSLLCLLLVQNVAGTPDSTVMLWAPQNPGAKIVSRQTVLCLSWTPGPNPYTHTTLPSPSHHKQ